MKQQLNQLAAYQPGLSPQLAAYQPGLSPQALKEKHGIEGELYKLFQMKIYMVLLQKQSKQFAHLDELFYYPETGSPSLRKAISEHLNVDSSRILFGAGLDEVILMISRAVLTPGDKIVTSEGTFGQYYHNAMFKHIWMSYFIILRRAHLHYVRQLVNI